jgi:glycerate-2-kinase
MTANETQMTKDALRMARAAIRAVYPDVAIRDRLRVECDDEGRRVLVARADVGGGGVPARELAYDLSEYDNVRIVSFGKASAAMALAAAEVLSDSMSRSNTPATILDGVVIIKDDHATDEEIKTLNEKYNILVRSASHPVPDARSVAAATEILELASSSDSRTLILACISGGGSALFCSPRDTLTLDDLMAVNRRLLESGMPIEHMNVIRKRLENGKGGRLAAAAYPATVLALVLSDIIGDPLDLIASGPTVPDDGSSWDDAYGLVNAYGLEHELPIAVLDLLLMGKDGKLDDTPKSVHPAFSTMGATEKHPSKKEQKLFSETILVGNNDAAVLAAADEAAKMGYNPVILGTRVDGKASCVASFYISMAEMLSRQRNDAHIKYPIASLPVALIAGGETVVTLPPNCQGKGGRNQELALSAALKMQEVGLRDVVLASIGTDGADGPTDAAGAIVYGGIVNEDTISYAKDALGNHDAYKFFERTQSLVMTGPTGTNVADICITLIK